MIVLTFFSLIVPNLNEEQYLPLFLSSLANQSFKDFETVIIDGDSSDHSYKIILDFIASHRSMSFCLLSNPVRNIGYIRNFGGSFAKGKVLFHTSSDTYFEPELLKKVYNFYQEGYVAVSGRTYPLGTSLLSHLGYQAFDLLRFLFTVSPFPLKKFRPSGNFCSVCRGIFDAIGGFPNVKINEDGLFGQRIDEYIKEYNQRVMFSLNLYVGHNVKRFEKVGGVQSLLFYSYVLANMFPFLKPLLKNIEVKSAKIFASRSDIE